MKDAKVQFIMMLPALIKCGAYLFLGAGVIANGLGHATISNGLLAVASVMGIGDAVLDAKTQ